MFIVKGSEMKAIDDYMINQVGLPSLVLMENAAKSVVDEITKRYTRETIGNKPIVILCGVGNNGGDGFAISRWLIHLGYEVMPILIGNQHRMSEDCRKEYNILNLFLKGKNRKPVFIYSEDQNIDSTINEDQNIDSTINKDELAYLTKQSSLIIDSILGTGCNRTLSKLLVDCVELVNQSKALRIAVDVPTGINADNGKVMGAAIRADITISFCLPKLGLILYPGGDYTGELIISDIGIQEEALLTLKNPIELLTVEYLEKQLNYGVLARPKFSHKGSFGTVGVIAGDKNMLGASILVAKAAYRTGAGLVKVFVEEGYGHLFLQSVPECVIVSYEPNGNKEDMDKALENFVLSSRVVTLGPGLSTSVRARHFVERVLQLDAKVVLDADALNIVSQQIDIFEERLCECVITPHIGEMARLTGYCSSGIAENTLQFASAFSEKYQVTTVLKSSRTVITTKNQFKYINYLGNSGMATGGSGDALVGVIAGCISMGLDIEGSAVMGTLLHSYAGDFYTKTKSEYTLMATGIIDSLWQGLV